jgi:diaminopimelate decarboxylase
MCHNKAPTFKVQCHINLGGGIGVNYADLTSQFEWDNFVENFKTLIVESKLLRTSS